MSERVRVAVRINPHSADPISLYETESLEGSGFKLTMKGSGPLDQSQVGTVKRQLDGIFQVDDVLIGEVSQEEVWQRFETPIMENVFDSESGLARFGVTLMAYGQTGAGKTFTMMGPEECKHQPLIDGNIHKQAGICLRLCHSLFQRIRQNQETHAVHTIVTVGLLELYNEKMFDLLGPGPWNQNINDRKALQLGKNRAGYWPMGQVLKSAENLTEVAAHLVEGYKHVTMGATAMNERSSRGHTIITIKVSTGDPALPLNHKIAKIQIVDLAGSERASATDGKAKEGGVTHLGTLKEATAINKALYNLGMMVEAAGKPPKQKDNTGKPLSEEKQRSEVEKNIRLKSNDSVLTKLLLDSIGGNVPSFACSFKSKSTHVKVHTCVRVS
jgi:kinesin family protein 12